MVLWAELIVAVNKKFIIIISIILKDKCTIWTQGLQTKHLKEWERKDNLIKCSLERPRHRQRLMTPFEMLHIPHARLNESYFIKTNKQKNTKGFLASLNPPI